MAQWKGYLKMSNHYSYGRLVQTDILPRHNNTWYYKLNENLYEFYSYDTLVGYIMIMGDKPSPDVYFVEWAHTQHYSVTTSKQCTTLANELKRKYRAVYMIVERKEGMRYLDTYKSSRIHEYGILHNIERN